MQVITETLSSLHLGTALTHGRLAMFPLLADSDRAPEYLTLDEALGGGAARIHEVSQSGSVPELRFENGGTERLLLLDGEELIGAKQNRILNVTILVGGRQDIRIPVSCVEQGRWSSKSRGFSSSSSSLFAKARAKKMRQVSESLHRYRASGSAQDGVAEAGAPDGARFGTAAYSSDQGEIWNDVGDVLGSLGVRSDTMALSDAVDEVGSVLNDHVAALRPVERQVGAVFAVDGRVVGLDLFDSAVTFRKLMGKLVRSYSLDAIARTRADSVPPVQEAVRKFLEQVQAAAFASFPSIGEGETLRIDGGSIAGGALVAGGRMVHLCAFESPE